MSESPKPKKTGNFVNAVYYPNWRFYDGQTPASLNLDSVTHVFYAFARYDDHALTPSIDDLY
jgi:GH18 family chitinase